MTKDIKSYDEKVSYLVKIFTPQLKNLRGVSRPPKDWVQDQLLNPTGANGEYMSLAEATTLFGEEFYVLGSSPRIFTDYSWYKDIWFDTKQAIYDEFRQKNLSFLLAGSKEVILAPETADELVKLFTKANALAADYEHSLNDNILVKNTDLLSSMIPKLTDLSDEFKTIFEEIVIALKDAKENNIDFAKYPNFSAAFGRSMQYIAFEKK